VIARLQDVAPDLSRYVVEFAFGDILSPLDDKARAGSVVVRGRWNTRRSLTPEAVEKSGFEEARVPVAVKLSALWASTMFVYVYVDIVRFYEPGVVRDILRGQVWEFDITQAWALGALALMSVPALMVFLSVGLRPDWSRWANIVVAGLYIVVSLGNLAGEDWAYLYLGAAIEVALLATIIRTAWTWPRTP
jgi:Family of unknown function (DUF6326)